MNNIYHVHFENENGDILLQNVEAESLRSAVIKASSDIKCKKNTKFIPINCTMLDKDETIQYEDIRSDYEERRQAV